MDKKIANNVAVGLFVLLGFVGFVFVIFNIGDGKGFLRKQFSLYAKYPNMRGLHYGSEVSLSGLRIGVIKDITVDKEDGKSLIVELSLSKEMAHKITEDSIANIQTMGVLGDKYIEITMGSPQLPPLKDGSFIPTAEREDLFAKSGDLIEGISKQFGKGGDIESLIRSLSIVAQNLSIITSDIRTKKGIINEAIYGNSGKSLSGSLRHLEEILRKIDAGEGTLGALINDPTVYEDVKYLMGGAKRSSVLKYFMRSFIDSGKEEKK